MYHASWSQFKLFNTCSLMWYFTYIEKIKVQQDTSFLDVGLVVHKILENHYSGKYKIIDEAKNQFEGLWLEKHLENSILKNKKDEYWQMCINGINLNKTFTTMEFKMFFDDVVGYLDGINTTEDEIIDWKTGTRSEESDKEYGEQLIFYSWLYKRKFGRLPKQAIVYYIKHTGIKQALIIIPTIEQVDKIEQEYKATLIEMDKYANEKIKPKKCNDCFKYCLFTDLCFNNKLDYTLEILGSEIKILGKIPPLLEKGITKKFSFELEGAHFIKKFNPMINTRIHLYNKIKQTLPIGFLEGLKKTLNDYAEYQGVDVDIKIVDKRIFNPTIIKNNHKQEVVLRDYQLEAKTALLKNKIAIIRVGTGGGKTEFSVVAIDELGYKTLILVNRLELAKQWKERIEKYFDVTVGMIGGGENDCTKHITIATVQTISKNIAKYKDFLNSIRISVWDEIHNANGKTYFKIHKMLTNAEYRAGLSGTPYRMDKGDLYLEAICGKIVYEHSASDLIEDEWLVRPTITFIKNYQTENYKQILKNTATNMINETEEYLSVYKRYIVLNEERNNYIKKIVDENKDKRILILVKLVEHGQMLSTMLETDYFYGGTKNDERDKLLNAFKNDTPRALIGTLQIFQEGLDIPNLDIIINAAGQKSDIRTIQSLGRLLRKSTGKVGCLYFDFMDDHKFLANASRTRIRAFKKEEHTVNFLEITETQNI